MNTEPARLPTWQVAIAGGLCWALLLWSMALPNAVAPLFLFWMLAGLAALGLGYLWWKSPADYALLASASLVGLPVAGEWANVGGWVAASLIGMAGLRWCIGAMKGKQRFPHRFRLAVGLTIVWVAWGIVCGLASPEVSISLPVALRMALLVTGGLACGNLIGLSPAALQRWALVTSVGICTIAAWTWIGWPALAKAAPAPYWQDANFASAGIALLLPLLAWGALVATKPWTTALRILFVATFGFLLVSVLKFDSRGAWLSLLVAAATVPLFLLRRKSWRLLWLASICTVGIVAVLAFQKLGNPQPASHEPIDRIQSITNTEDFSNRERLMRWRCAWRMAVDQPVLGHGLARFAPQFKDYLRSQEEVNQIAWWFGWRFGAHSDPLNALAETGFPGMVLLLAMLGAWAIAILGRHDQQDNNRAIKTAILIALVTWLVHSQFNDLLTSHCIAAWVFLLLGMLGSESKEMGSVTSAAV